ncbi:MAG: insulinase family protein [Deltaproteobacteria bacterium]|nr:insulinase family protein [Deltaproteobacteria bacterium]
MTTSTTQRFDLPGGAVGYVESSSVVPLVSIVVSLRSGSLADPDGKDGLSRLTARMIRRGCKGMTSPEIESAIDRLGGEVGLDVGPSTISLHAQVIRRNLVPFCELLARILGTPTFDEQELGRLKRETVAELLDARDNDRALAGLAFRRALFPGHPYSRTAAGRPGGVEALGRDDVLSTYARAFVQSNAVLGFAGAITTEEAKELGAQLVGALGNGPRTVVNVPEPQRRAGRHLAFVDKPDRTQTQILIGTLGTWPKDPDHVPLVTATAVLGGTFTSRMMREIRSKRGWSYGTSARLSIERQRHAFTMSAAPGAGDCAPCIALELELLEQFVEKGITPRELSFIKNYLVRSHAFEVDTAPKRLGQALEIDLLDLPADYHTGYIDHIKGVTVEACNAGIQARLFPSDVVVIVVGTAGELVEKIAKAIPGLASQEIIPFDRD